MIGKLTAAALAALFAAGSGQAAEYVVNGGFEQTTKTGNFEFGASRAAQGYGDAVVGWTSANPVGYNLLFNSATANSVSAVTRYGNSIEYIWSSTASPTGGNFVALDGDSDIRGALTQTLTGLTVGQSYTLTFDWAAAQLRSRGGATTEQLKVSFGDDSFSTEVLNNPDRGFSGWKTVTRTFTAKSTSQVLSFLSIGTPNGAPPLALLDSVSVTNAVPEPATWAMMIGGFGLVGGAMRRQRRDAPATC